MADTDRVKGSCRAGRWRGWAPVVCLTVVACGGAGSDVALRMTAAESGTPFTLPALELPRHDGGSFSLARDVEGRYTLLFFGYTHCPDVCPIAVSTARQSLLLLTPEERASTQVVFVSVDPARDSVPRLEEWVEGLGGSIVALRASRTELEAVFDAMGFRMPPTTSNVPFEEGGPDAYLVPHPTALFLVTPDGHGRYQYGFGRASPQEIAEDLRLLRSEG